MHTTLMTDFDQKSLTYRFYTEELAQQYKNIQTRCGWAINDVIRSGRDKIGLYAGGDCCYAQFSALFDGVTEAYHHHSLNQPHPTSWELTAPLPNPDPDGRFIQSTRIRVARNFAGVPFPAAISLKQRLEQEAIVKECLETHLDGRYYTLSTMPKSIDQLLFEQKSQLTYGDHFMERGGFNRDWPHGRGVFVHDSHQLFIWFGEEDFLRIISLAFDTDLAAVFNRLAQTATKLEQLFDFATDERYGYLTSCPSNVGTTMRASFNIHLPKLHQHPDLLHDTCKRLELQLRGSNGENTAVENAVYDVSNRQRLGLSEAELVTLLNSGTRELIHLETSL